MMARIAFDVFEASTFLQKKKHVYVYTYPQSQEALQGNEFFGKCVSDLKGVPIARCRPFPTYEFF